MSDQTPVQLFSRLYLEKGPPKSDSDIFRKRIGYYCEQNYNSRELARYLRTELGHTVTGTHYFSFEQFFVQLPLSKCLDAITLVREFLRAESSPFFVSWRDFVSRVLDEENMDYIINEKARSILE